MGRKTWRHGVPHKQNCAVCGDNLAKINMIYHFYAPGQLEYSSIDKMSKYDWSTFRNYVAFLAGQLAPGTRHPHHDSESSSCYHDAFLSWGHYHIQHRVILPRFSYNTIAFHGPHRSCYKGVLLYNKEWDITVIQPISSTSTSELLEKALVDIWIDLYLIKFQFLPILCVLSSFHLKNSSSQVYNPVHINLIQNHY